MPSIRYIIALVPLVILISANLVQSSVMERRRCPLNDRHHAAFGQWASRLNETHRLSLLTPSLHHHAFRTLDESQLNADDPLTLAGSVECPERPESSLDEPLMGRSLCPWYWRMNYDPNRIPAVLPEAVCRCQRAVTGTRGLVPYECQPLTMHVRVLQLDESCQEFHERSLEMSVACVSVFQSAVRLNKTPGVQRVFHPQHLQQQDKK